MPTFVPAKVLAAGREKRPAEFEGSVKTQFSWDLGRFVDDLRFG